LKGKGEGVTSLFWALGEAFWGMRLFGEGKFGLEPGVDAAVEDGDVLEAEFIHEEGGFTGTGTEGAVDEGGAGGVEGLEALAGFFGFELVDVVGAGEVAVAEFVLHAAVDDLEAGLGGDEGLGGGGVEEVDGVWEGDDGGFELGGR
jgi:hypothetical protein